MFKLKIRNFDEDLFRLFHSSLFGAFTTVPFHKKVSIPFNKVKTKIIFVILVFILVGKDIKIIETITFTYSLFPALNVLFVSSWIHLVK